MNPDVTTAVPAPLLEFQLTLRAPDGISPAALLGSYDGYVNAAGPPVAAVHHAVPMREVAGWRLGADITVPLGDPPFPVLVYLHGGGWIMGAPHTHRRLATELAALGLLVVSVDYRRAPKHRFPAAVEDAEFAVGWAAGHAVEYGGDPSRVLVGGDSAGANLAACVLTGTTAGRAVAAALLLYGIYDYHRALPVLAPLLAGHEAHTQLYLPAEDFEAVRGDPRLSPEGHGAGMPPTLVAVGGRDPLLDESLAFAAHLAGTGVTHELVVLDDAPHAFLQLPTHPAHDDGLTAIEGFLGRHGFVTPARES